MIRVAFYLVVVIFSVANIPTIAHGQSSLLGGGVIVRIPDNLTSRCVNGATDRIDLYLVSMISHKHRSIFRSTTAVGLYIETLIEGATSEAEQKIIIPRSFMIDVSDYGSSLVRLPVEQKLLSRFKLRNGDNLYSNATFRIKFISSEEDGPVKIALHTLSDVTKRLPIPSNPFIEGIDYFVELSNGIVSAMMDENKNPDKVVPEAQLAFEFSQDGQCTGQLETTGIKAVIKEYSKQQRHSDKYIDIAQIHTYCFRYSNANFKRIEFASKPAGGCADVTEYKQVINPHYVFALNATPAFVQHTSRQNSVMFMDSPVLRADMATPVMSPLTNEEMTAGWRAWSAANSDTTSAEPQILSFMEEYAAIYREFASTPKPDISGLKLGLDTGSFGKLNAYDLGSDIAQLYGERLGMGTEGALGDDAFLLGWALSGSEAAAKDVYESTQRCKFLGIKLQDCF